MGTVKDPRQSEREKNEYLEEEAEQEEQSSAQPEPEKPEYRITDWASF